MRGELRDLSEAERVAALSTVAVLGLALVKVVAGLLTGSVALVADAAHSFSDVFTSLVVFLGVRVSRREPSRRFPFGYHRAENLATLVVSLAILLTGLSLLYTAATSVEGGIENHGAGLAVALGSAGVNLWLFRLKARVGESANSQSLVAGSRDSLVDALASGIVFAGVLGARFGVPYADAAAAALVSVMVLRIGGVLMRDASLSLMDVGPGPEVVRTVRETALRFPRVEGVHDVRLRRVGGRVFGEMHLHMDRNLSLKDAHDLSNEVEEAVRDEVGSVEHVLVHFGPTGEKREGPSPAEEHRDT